MIPTGYINAKIKNCSINGLSISTSSEKDYAGGFIGQQKGTIIENCSITNSNYTISGKRFTGGFVGLARDDVIEGTLSGALDIQTKLPNMNPESLLLNCSINNKGLKVLSETYAGGFAGALANTSAVNCTVKSTNKFEVKATSDYAGGFAGIASLGWSADLGKGDTKNKNNLLGDVVDLVVKLLSNNADISPSLLSLAGVNPSYILGATVSGPLNLSGVDYVGGMTGRGNGAYIASSSADYLNKVSYWRNKVYDTASVSVKDVELSGVQSITGKNFVGGIAGSLGTAKVAGLLNDTLGLASYLGFTVDKVTVTGPTTGLSITGEQRIGGGFGDAIGGSINTVTIKNLKSVTGNNRVGGMIGLAGPGDLADTGGLTVNLLGLNHLLQVKNLLKVASGVRVTINDSHVIGVADGLTVKATGTNSDGGVVDYVAGGFVGKSHSCEINKSDVKNLKEVSANDTDGYAGGFIGTSQTGGLADVASEEDLKGWITKDTSVL